MDSPSLRLKRPALQSLSIAQVFIESIKQGEVRPIKLSKNAMLVASLLHKDLAVL